MTIKNLEYVKINCVNPSYFIFGKVNGYLEEINGNKHLPLFPINEGKELMKKYEELWSKIRNLMRSIAKQSDDYINIHIHTHTHTYIYIYIYIPLSKTIKIHIATIVVRAIFLENNKYYPQVFLDECLYKLYSLVFTVF